MRFQDLGKKMIKKILLISGKQGSGKTTIQKAVEREWGKYKGHHSMTINFADPLYEMHNFAWGVLGRYGFELNQKKDGYLLQMLGTEWGREKVDQDIWVKIARRKIDDCAPRSDWPKKMLFIIGDCRFENEFDAFSDAHRVRLECREEIRKARAEMWRDTTDHPSEIGLDRYADLGKFDQGFRTDSYGVSDCVHLIMHQLLKDGPVMPVFDTPETNP